MRSGNAWVFAVGMCEPCRARVLRALEGLIGDGKVLLARLKVTDEA